MELRYTDSDKTATMLKDLITLCLYLLLKTDGVKRFSKLPKTL